MSPHALDRVLTLGAGGMIGAYVDFGIRPSREECDITDEASVERVVGEAKPSAILLLAGATDMKRCEEDPAYAYELNARGTYNVARAASAHDATLVYASTSRVFRGDKEAPYEEGDAPEPDTHYGRTKHIGEMIVRSLVPSHLIARTAWVFGGGPVRDDKFYGKVIQQLLEGKEVSALSDVQGSPTYGKDYVAAIQKLLEEGANGTFHIANGGVATRYDLALAMARELGTDTVVRAVDRTHFPSANLPANEAISSKTIRLRSWEEALAEYVAGEWGRV